MPANTNSIKKYSTIILEFSFLWHFSQIFLCGETRKKIKKKKKLELTNKLMCLEFLRKDIFIEGGSWEQIDDDSPWNGGFLMK